MIFKKTKPSKESTISDHLLFAVISRLFEELTILANSTILANRNNKFVFEIKENLLIKQARSILSKNSSSAELFLFDND